MGAGSSQSPHFHASCCETLSSYVGILQKIYIFLVLYTYPIIRAGCETTPPTEKLPKIQEHPRSATGIVLEICQSRRSKRWELGCVCFPSSQGAQAGAWPQCPGLPHRWQGHSGGTELLLTENSHMGGGMVSGCCW